MASKRVWKVAGSLFAAAGMAVSFAVAFLEPGEAVRRVALVVAIALLFVAVVALAISSDKVPPRS